MATDTQINSDGGPSNRRRKLSDIKGKLLRPSLTSQYICKFSFPGPVENWTREKGTPFESASDLQYLVRKQHFLVHP